jgi:phosphoketolase
VGSTHGAPSPTGGRAPTGTVISEEELRRLDAHWRAANYLTVGQIYLRDNPLLTKPLTPDHLKPRLLGHWGTSPGLNIVYTHLNRVIREHDEHVLFITGPGHGGPAILANVYLEGSYSEIYPDVSRDAEGMLRPFRQFSTPGACRATSARPRLVRSTKVASWAMRSSTRSAPPSTTPVSSSPA